LNSAFPKQNLESIDVFSFLKMQDLDDLQLKQVGLLHLQGIADIFPSLECLDLADNKIFSVEALEELHKLEDLSDVSFKNNPICIHKHLEEMVMTVVPNIEVVNQTQIKEAGHRYKMQIQ